MPTENRSSNTETAAKLSPCPFCGQQDFLIERIDSDASVVICQGLTGPHEACLARGPVGVAQDEGEEQPGRDKAVELWNARAEQRQGQLVERDELPPFAQKVLKKLRRTQECFEDSQGTDIGRDWLDVLVRLGLMNRVQRSPALWEISDAGDALLEARAALEQKPA